MTPQFGEMAALTACGKEDVTPNLATIPAGRVGATIVLKAGIIGALLARGAIPHIAAAWGVRLHGEAGRQLASSVGPTGLLSRELLPQVSKLPERRAGHKPPGELRPNFAFNLIKRRNQ